MQKKIIALFVFVLAVMTMISSVANNRAVFAAEEEPAIDVIFIMDLSGSMEDSDPEKVSLMSVAMFADVLDDSSSQVGYVLFGTDVVKNMPLTPIGQAKAQIHNNVLTSEFNEDWTNIPAGLDNALALFRQSNSTNQKIAILFTDGNVKMPRGKGLTHEQGEEKSREIAKVYRDAGIPLYTVGLNYDGNLKLDFIQELSELSSAPGLSAKSYEAKTNWDIPEIFSRIFINTYNGNADVGLEFNSKEKQQTAVFSAEEGIYEFNVILLHRNSLENLVIRRPDGQEYQDAQFVQRDGYSFVKIRYPAVGDWELSFQGDYISANKLVRYITKTDKTVTVTFDTDGGNVLEPASIPVGRSLQDVTKPVKDGYRFEGWYLNEARTQQLSDGHTFSKDTVLYAKWMPDILYHITFTGDGIDTKTVQVQEGDKVSSYLEDLPRRKGYRFTGWYLDTGTKLDENALVNQNLTLTARWEEIKVNVIPSVLFLVLALAIFIGGFFFNKRRKKYCEGIAVLFLSCFSLAAWLWLKGYLLPVEIMVSPPVRDAIGSLTFAKSMDMFVLWGGFIVPLVLNLLLAVVLPLKFVLPGSSLGKERQYFIHLMISLGGLLWPLLLWILYGINFSAVWLLGYSFVVYTGGFFLTALLFRQGRNPMCFRFFF